MLEKSSWEASAHGWCLESWEEGGQLGNCVHSMDPWALPVRTPMKAPPALQDGLEGMWALGPSGEK